MRVALFVTCVNDLAFPETGIATVRLLERLGVEVTFPQAQTCCGQMQYNTGYPDLSAPLAEKFARDFAGFEAVVIPSGSCGAFVRDVHPSLTGVTRADVARTDAARTDAAQAGGDRAKAAVPPVYELTEFLIDVLGVEDVGAYFPHRVAYHPTCHSTRLLKLDDRPARLLRAVEGLELVELPGAAECCGFGGTFAVKNPDVSAAMGTDKVSNAVASGAEYLVAADNSCLMHIGGTARRSGAPISTLHLAQILAHSREQVAA